MSASWALFFRIRRYRRPRVFIKSNRDTTLRFLRGFTQGLHRLRTDKEFSMKVLSKYTKVTDARDAGATASNLRRAL